jgi:isopenicillin-N epimerase
MNRFKELFLLDPEVVFLNHGSFGATPKPVFEVFQAWQRLFERQPVAFVDRDMAGYFRDAREKLGTYINASADDLVYVPNVTFAVNLVARSLDLGPGDEVLTTDHEYGACDRIWQFMSDKKGFETIRQHIPLPVTTPEDIVEQLWEGVTSRTRLIFISHITSSTALHLPVEAICRRAAENGIMTMVDGAHAPGQIELDVKQTGADFYAGNCHKWLCGPKGSAFLYTTPNRQHLIEPLVVSWGWGEENILSYGSEYLDYVQWWGTIYPAAYLAIPAAIQFQEDHDWPRIRRRCHNMLTRAISEICELTGLPSFYPPETTYYHQMAIAPLPRIEDHRAFKKKLFDHYRIEIPCLEWHDHSLIRLSIQAYNSQEDVDMLLEALTKLLPEHAHNR